jgi:hypothetical protein
LLVFVNMSVQFDLDCLISFTKIWPFLLFLILHFP